MNTLNEFSEFLRNLRGTKSLREMERLTGLSHTYLSTLEKGFDPRSGKERNPTPEVIKKISQAFPDVDYLEMMMKAGYISDRSKTVLEGKGGEDYQNFLSQFPKEIYNLMQEHNSNTAEFNIPTYIEEVIDGNTVRKRLSAEDGLKRFLNITHLLQLENINYNGRKLSKNDIDKILKVINDMENQFEYED